MKNKHLTKASIVSCLKKLFSVQTMTVIASIASICAAYFAYITFVNNQSPQLSREFYLFDHHINVDDKRCFLNLIAPNHNLISLGSGEANYFPTCIPNIVNNTSKSIKDLLIEVTISYRDLEIQPKDICKDFDIIKHDEACHLLTLRYKYDILNAGRAIPIPVSWIQLPKYASFSKDKYHMFWLYYTITYDGIPKPQEIFSYNYVYFDGELSLRDEHIDEFLTMAFEEGYLTWKKNTTLVSVINHLKSKIAIPPKALNVKNFVKFKKDFIISSKEGIKLQ